MQIVAALFVEDLVFREAPGPSTRIDLTGVHFSMAADELPTTVAPHLVVLIWCPPDQPGQAALEVRFLRPGEDEPVARNVMPVQVEPGRFTRQLVRAELEFDEAGTIEAHCRVDLGEVTIVPFTLLPPVG